MEAVLSNQLVDHLDREVIEITYSSVHQKFPRRRRQATYFRSIRTYHLYKRRYLSICIWVELACDHPKHFKGVDCLLEFVDHLILAVIFILQLNHPAAQLLVDHSMLDVCKAVGGWVFQKDCSLKTLPTLHLWGISSAPQRPCTVWLNSHPSQPWLILHISVQQGVDHLGLQHSPVSVIFPNNYSQAVYVSKAQW